MKSLYWPRQILLLFAEETSQQIWWDSEYENILIEPIRFKKIYMKSLAGLKVILKYQIKL